MFEEHKDLKAAVKEIKLIIKHEHNKNLFVYENMPVDKAIQVFMTNFQAAYERVRRTFSEKGDDTKHIRIMFETVVVNYFFDALKQFRDPDTSNLIHTIAKDSTLDYHQRSKQLGTVLGLVLSTIEWGLTHQILILAGSKIESENNFRDDLFSYTKELSYLFKYHKMNLKFIDKRILKIAKQPGLSKECKQIILEIGKILK